MTESHERQNERRRKTPFLILISGARPEVLDRCPTERIKFQSLGWAILITCGMATVSMWFALTSAMGFSPYLSLPVAIMWGLIIMGIDRWLVTSMPLDGKRKFLIATPRLALAILLGSLISTPIVLRIFESEINNQVSIIKEQNEAQFLSSQQSSSIQATINKWQSDVSNLEQVIDSRGAAPINPANDPVVQGLTSQLNNERKVAASDYAAWQCQLYGVGNCGTPKGDGPLAAADQLRYQNDEAQITKLTQEISARETQLQATDVASQASRLQQAKNALPTAQAQLSAAQGEENSLLNNFQGTNSAANGLLIRLKALDQLAAGSSTLQAARILLFLLFLVIELLPVTVKLLQPQGNYEKILRQEIEREYAKADWELRGDFEPVETFRSTGDPRQTKVDDGFAEWSQHRPRDPREAELAAVWEQYSRAESAPDWESRTGNDFPSPLDDDTTGPHRLDDILRAMPDTRAMGGYEERQGGIERRYGEEEL